MLCGENRGKWKGRQPPGVKPRTPLAWAGSALPLSHNSQATINPHNLLYALHAEWLPGVWVRAFSTTCAVHIEYCEGCWSSSCRGSVAEHWQLKPEVSWVQLPAAAGLFTFLYFHLIASNLQHEARCSATYSTYFLLGTRRMSSH